MAESSAFAQATAGILGDEQSTPRLRGCVVGAGFGGRLSLDALDASPLYELVGIADVNPRVREELAERRPGVPVFTGHAELLGETHPDVVCVSTLPTSHVEVASAALRAGVRGLLVEKPLAESWPAAAGLLQQARASQVPVVVPHGLLALATPLDILRAVHDGGIGRVCLVDVEFTHWDAFGAGVHWIDFFLHLVPDDVETVLAAADVSTRTYRDGMQVETEALVSVTCTSGARLVLHSGDDIRISKPGHDIVYRIVGDAGVIEFFGWSPGYRITNGSGSSDRLPPDLGRSAHQVHLERLAALVHDQVIDDREAEISLRALEIAEAAYVSMRHGGNVSLPCSPSAAATVSDWKPGLPYTGSGGGRDGRRI